MRKNQTSRKIPGVKWYPSPAKGKITESHFNFCYCYETTQDQKPEKSCQRCKGTGSTTDIWVEPLIIK